MEPALALYLLQLSERPGGYSIVLGNWQREQFEEIKQEFPTVTLAMAERVTLRSHMRMVVMGNELWRGRCAFLGMRIYSPPLYCARSKFFAVRKGHQTGIFYVLAEAKAQVLGYSGPEWGSFKTLQLAMDFMAVEDMVTGPAVEQENQVTVYTDGSCLKKPKRAGWGLTAIHSADRLVVYSDRKEIYHSSGRVCLVSTAADFQGATSETNNTAELTAAGEAMRWAAEGALPEGVTTVRIVTDSRYVLNMLDRGGKAKKNGPLIRSLKTRLLALRERFTVLIDWTKAHKKEVETLDDY